MRDRRFVAVHRGGPLGREDHAALALWAANCARRALPLFERENEDARPRQALVVARAWARGSVRTGVAMKASLAAHAAARGAADAASTAAARAAGHAAATAHCADHCMGALLYALKAFAAAERPAGSLLRAELAKVPPHLRDQVAEGVWARLGRGFAARMRDHPCITDNLKKMLPRCRSCD